MIRIIFWAVMLSVMPFSADARSWSGPNEFSITRCFNRKNIKIWCEDFSYVEDKKHFLVQELQIQATDFKGITRTYGYGKAFEGTLCQSHLKRIRHLVRQSPESCFTGHDESFIGKTETFSRWHGVETKAGEFYW